MKRYLTVFLVFGLCLIGGVGKATADRTDKPAGNATVAELEAFVAELHRTRADLALAQSSVFGSDWREEECRFQSLERPTWTQREEDLTAACVTRRLGRGVSLADVMRIAACESGWNRLAVNPGDPSYLGLFQHSSRYWQGRTSLVPQRWRIGRWWDWRNSRAQLIVSVRMASSGGWDPWGCA